jgi:hypothetical protein
MKYFPFSVIAVIALLGASSAASTAWAYEHQRADRCGNGGREHVCIRDQPDESKLVRHCCYHNTYGDEVHAPSPTHDGTRPLQAAAQCRDGYYSFSKHRSGTCSSHRGVQRWFGG